MALLFAMVAPIGRSLAHETDQYTLPVGREFADLRFYFSAQFHDAIKFAMDKTNAKIRASLRDGQPTAETRRLQSPDSIAYAVLWEFPSAVHYVDMMEIELRGAEEVTHGFGKQTAPTGVNVYSPAFDVTPCELITGIITERGVLRPPYVASIAALAGPQAATF